MSEALLEIFQLVKRKLNFSVGKKAVSVTGAYRGEEEVNFTVYSISDGRGRSVQINRALARARGKPSAKKIGAPILKKMLLPTLKSHRQVYEGWDFTGFLEEIMAD